MVLTTVGDMHAGTIMYITELYSKPSPTDFFDLVNMMNDGNVLRTYVDNIDIDSIASVVRKGKQRVRV